MIPNGEGSLNSRQALCLRLRVTVGSVLLRWEVQSSRHGSDAVVCLAVKRQPYWEGDGVNTLDFLAGFVAGFVVSGFLGYLLQQRRVARGKAGAQRKPQTVTLKTDQTPREVVRSSRSAAIESFLWSVALILFLVALVWLGVRLLP
jgi:hypothetical protein